MNLKEKKIPFIFIFIIDAKAQSEYTIEEGAQMIKEQIDKRVKVRKEELDSIREKMHKQIDSYTEQLKT